MPLPTTVSAMRRVNAAFDAIVVEAARQNKAIEDCAAAYDALVAVLRDFVPSNDFVFLPPVGSARHADFVFVHIG